MEEKDHECAFPRAQAVENADEVSKIESEHDWKLREKQDYGGGLLTIMECEKCEAQKATILSCDAEKGKNEKTPLEGKG